MSLVVGPRAAALALSATAAAATARDEAFPSAAAALLADDNSNHRPLNCLVLGSTVAFSVLFNPAATASSLSAPVSSALATLRFSLDRGFEIFLVDNRRSTLSLDDPIVSPSNPAIIPVTGASELDEAVVWAGVLLGRRCNWVNERIGGTELWKVIDADAVGREGVDAVLVVPRSSWPTAGQSAALNDRRNSLRPLLPKHESNIFKASQSADDPKRWRSILLYSGLAASVVLVITVVIVVIVKVTGSSSSNGVNSGNSDNAANSLNVSAGAPTTISSLQFSSTTSQAASPSSSNSSPSPSVTFPAPTACRTVLIDDFLRPGVNALGLAADGSNLQLGSAPGNLTFFPSTTTNSFFSENLATANSDPNATCPPAAPLGPYIIFSLGGLGSVRVTVQTGCTKVDHVTAPFNLEWPPRDYAVDVRALVNAGGFVETSAVAWVGMRPGNPNLPWVLGNVRSVNDLAACGMGGAVLLS
ncbi:hypothetical protein DFJ73DRAFT_764471 [Zopfochytrium polystomum]|nr:hypothetical protein DFJ73DRAFT_764471 [Zopfochytrium polystomum]